MEKESRTFISPFVVPLSMMLSIDLHGLTVEKAVEHFLTQLNEVRLKRSSKEVHFITGMGLLRNKLEELAKECDLYYYIPMGNTGSIVIEFE